MVPTIRRTDPPLPSGSPLSRKGWAGVPWRTRARGMGSKERERGGSCEIRRSAGRRKEEGQRRSGVATGSSHGRVIAQDSHRRKAEFRPNSSSIFPLSIPLSLSLFLSSYPEKYQSTFIIIYHHYSFFSPINSKYIEDFHGEVIVEVIVCLRGCNARTYEIHCTVSAQMPRRGC